MQGSPGWVTEAEHAEYESRVLGGLLDTSGLLDSILGDGAEDEEEQLGLTGPSPVKTGVSRAAAKRAVWMLTMITFLDNAFYGVIVPFMPLYAMQMGLHMLQIGLIFSAYGVALILGTALLRGVSACKTFRTRLLILGAALGLFTSCAILTFFKSFASLLLARFTHGLFSAMLQVSSMRYIHECYEGEHVDSSMSRVMSAMALGMLFGPSLGGVCAQILGPRYMFLCGSIAFSLCGMVLSLVLNDTEAVAAPPFIHLLNSNWVCILSLGVSVIASVISSLQPILPPYCAAAFQSSQAWIGVIMSAFMAAYALATPLALWLLQSIDRHDVILYGFCALVASLIVLMMKTGYLIFVLVVIIVGAMAGIAVAPMVPALYDAANELETTNFWQIYSIFDLAFAVGIAVGPFFAGFTANSSRGGSGHHTLVFQLMVTNMFTLLYTAGLGLAQYRLAAIASSDVDRLNAGGYGAVGAESPTTGGDDGSFCARSPADPSALNAFGGTYNDIHEASM